MGFRHFSKTGFLQAPLFGPSNCVCIAWSTSRVVVAFLLWGRRGPQFQGRRPQQRAGQTFLWLPIFSFALRMVQVVVPIGSDLNVLSSCVMLRRSYLFPLARCKAAACSVAWWRVVSSYFVFNYGAMQWCSGRSCVSTPLGVSTAAPSWCSRCAIVSITSLGQIVDVQRHGVSLGSLFASVFQQGAIQGARVWQQCYFTVQLLSMGGSFSVVDAVGLVAGNYIAFFFFFFFAVQAAGRSQCVDVLFNSSDQERCL